MHRPLLSRRWRRLPSWVGLGHRPRFPLRPEASRAIDPAWLRGFRVRVADGKAAREEREACILLEAQRLLEAKRARLAQERAKLAPRLPEEDKRRLSRIATPVALGALIPLPRTATPPARRPGVVPPPPAPLAARPRARRCR